MIDEIIDRDFNEINLMRILGGSKSLKKKQKRCTECKSFFETTSSEIICKNCKHDIKKYYESERWDSNSGNTNNRP